MAKTYTSQEILRRILLHNKLVASEDLEFFLKDDTPPEIAVQRMVSSNVLIPQRAKQLMSLYRQQIAKLKASGGLAEDAKTKGKSAAKGAEPEAVDLAPASEDAPVLEVIEEEEEEIAVLEVAEDDQQASSAPRAAASSGGAVVTYSGATVGPRIEIGSGGKDLVQRMIKVGRELGGSDLYIKSNAPSMVRIYSKLQNLNMDPIPAEVCEKALMDCLNQRELDTFAERNDLDFSYEAGDDLGRCRTNYLRHLQGVDGIFRLIPTVMPSIEQLGLPDVSRWLISYRVGIVLVTGPKSSGKTTTLAALVDEINSTRTDHVIMIEDPIEYMHPCKKSHVNQREVGPHTRSFANAMRSVLREAPDVILVGEMRDLETTSLAITAAETGHLVLSTMNTPDATRTLGRLLDVFPPREQPQIRAMVSESLRGIMSQQLVPRADGTGMALAMEVLVTTTAIANLIRDDRGFQIPGIMQTGKKLGMSLMDDSLLELAKAGTIVKEEAVDRAFNTKRVAGELGVPIK